MIFNPLCLFFASFLYRLHRDSNAVIFQPRAGGAQSTALIRCADRNEHLLFAFDECVDPNYEPTRGDEVAFFVRDDALGLTAASQHSQHHHGGGKHEGDASTQVAVRITKLQRGTVVFEEVRVLENLYSVTFFPSLLVTV